MTVASKSGCPHRQDAGACKRPTRRFATRSFQLRRSRCGVDGDAQVPFAPQFVVSPAVTHDDSSFIAIWRRRPSPHSTRPDGVSWAHTRLFATHASFSTWYLSTHCTYAAPFDTAQCATLFGMQLLSTTTCPSSQATQCVLSVHVMRLEEHGLKTPFWRNALDPHSRYDVTFPATHPVRASLMTNPASHEWHATARGVPRTQRASDDGRSLCRVFEAVPCARSTPAQPSRASRRLCPRPRQRRTRRPPAHRRRRTAGRCPQLHVAVDDARHAIRARKAPDIRAARAACAKAGRPRDTRTVACDVAIRAIEPRVSLSCTPFTPRGS